MIRVFKDNVCISSAIAERVYRSSAETFTGPAGILEGELYIIND